MYCHCSDLVWRIFMYILLRCILKQPTFGTQKERAGGTKVCHGDAKLLPLLNEILDKIHPCLVVSENVWNNQAPQSVMFFY